jgi:hypothetical protein
MMLGATRVSDLSQNSRKTNMREYGSICKRKSIGISGHISKVKLAYKFDHDDELYQLDQ